MLAPVQVHTLAYPVAAGLWQVTREGVLCRFPRGSARVQAPAAFLRLTQKLCDGKTPWKAVSAKLARRWEPQDVEICLSELVRTGVLIEAGMQLAEQARLGWVPQVLPARLSDPDDLYQLRASQAAMLERPPSGHSLTPSPSALGKLLAGRQSYRTFGEASMSLQSLVNILWAIYGVASQDDAGLHRTVPSAGGLYALHWYVALLRDTGDFAAGLYRVNYSRAGGSAGSLNLDLLRGEAQQAWTSLLMPAVLSHAQAVIYSVADIQTIAAKYGNRALTLAMVESGHCLQNAAIAAIEEKAATIVRSDTVETEVQSMFGLSSDRYPMPALVLGTLPSTAETEVAKAAGDRVLVRSVGNSTRKLSLASNICVAGPIQIGGHAIWTAGRSADPHQAAIKAEAEAWERIGWTSPPELLRARRKDLKDAVDPRTLVAYSQAQYARDDFPFTPWSERRTYPWVQGIELASGRPVSIMAQCAFAWGSLAPEDARSPYTNASTSGMAAWPNAQGAISRALVELVERDAFTRAWLAADAPAALEIASLPSYLLRRIKALQAAGYRASLQVLPSDHLPAVSVSLQRLSHCFTSVTTGAGYTFEEALDAAVGEAESRAQGHHDLSPPSRMEPKKVRLATEHGAWFRTPAGFRDADWYVQSRGSVSLHTLDHRHKKWPGNGDQLMDHFADAGLPVYSCDMTPSGASIHQGRQSVHVWRVFVPTLVPIWFGYGLEPGGMVSESPLHSESRSAHKSLHPCT